MHPRPRSSSFWVRSSFLAFDKHLYLMHVAQSRTIPLPPLLPLFCSRILQHMGYVYSSS